MVKVLILGATGRQGGATARALLSSGKHSVRAFVRDASSEKAKALAAAGAEIFEGSDWDKEDVTSLDSAFVGVEAVFFISNPSFADMEAETRSAVNIVEAAKRAGTVRHVVYSTVAMAQGGTFRDIPGWDRWPFFANYWLSKAKGEELVRTGGFAHHTILRPTEFMSNYTVEAMAKFQVPDLVSEGVWHTALPGDFKVNLISPEDIGRVAAAAISAPTTFAGGAHELTINAERLPVSELVAQLAEAAGKKLTFVTYTRDEAEAVIDKKPIIGGQLCRLDLSKSGKAITTADDFGLGFKTFKEHLAENREDVVEIYKNVP
ncbi:NAD(P)-binding protein [Hypoxylon crocopeplum]|nr:NAD(P)-binding protein [Hypoxylon crocopeplum]